jgi:hypothetical protein
MISRCSTDKARKRYDCHFQLCTIHQPSFEVKRLKLSDWSQSLYDEDALPAFKIVSAKNTTYVHI